MNKIFSAPIPSKPWLDPSANDTENERAQKAFKSVYTITPRTEAELAIQNKTLDDKRGEIFLDGMYNGFLLYLLAVQEFLNPNQENQTIRGISAVKNMMGTSFQGRRQDNVTMNCNGLRVSQFVLLQMNKTDKLSIVAGFDTIDKKMVMYDDIIWPNGKQPLDTPTCGFDMSKCPCKFFFDALLKQFVYSTTLIFFLQQHRM